MNSLIYAACDGKVGDMKALENSTYWEFCAILNSYLEKVEVHNREIEKMKRQHNLTSDKRPLPQKKKR